MLSNMSQKKDICLNATKGSDKTELLIADDSCLPAGLINP